jgi:IS1 family transposase
MLGIKNYRWIWIVVDREVRKYVNFAVGDRSTGIGRNLWERVKKSATGVVISDY